MNEVQEICRLLDERGIRYRIYDDDAYSTVIAFDWADQCDDYLKRITVVGSCICAEHSYLTPKMAVDAILGELCHITYCEDDYGMDGWLCDGCGEWFAATLNHTPTNNIRHPHFCPSCGRRVVQP